MIAQVVIDGDEVALEYEGSLRNAVDEIVEKRGRRMIAFTGFGDHAAEVKTSDPVERRDMFIGRLRNAYPGIVSAHEFVANLYAEGSPDEAGIQDTITSFWDAALTILEVWATGDDEELAEQVCTIILDLEADRITPEQFYRRLHPLAEQLMG